MNTYKHNISSPLSGEMSQSDREGRFSPLSGEMSQSDREGRFSPLSGEMSQSDREGLYALVTGASSGIGYEYAWVLAKRGYDLIIVSNEEAINEKAEELKAEFPDRNIIPLVRDLGKQTAAKELYEWCTNANPSTGSGQADDADKIVVEVLVNNAGVYHDKDFLDDSEGFTELILNLHVYTPAMLCYYFAKDMVNRHKGYILNMSSVTSGYGIQRQSTYSSTKGFLRIFSRSLHIELKSKGVNITCVRPGAVATPLYNLKPEQIKMGLAVGAIIRPRLLAEKGLDAMFKGKCVITPGFFTKILNLVPLIPVWMLKLIRRWGIF